LLLLSSIYILLTPLPFVGGVATQQSLIRGGLAPTYKPLPFSKPFLTEKVTLSYTFRRKWNTFHILIVGKLLRQPLKQL